MSIVYLDGNWVKAKSPWLESMTPGFFNAKGVFETMLGVDGAVLDINLHLKRFQSGLKILGLASPIFNRQILTEVQERNKLDIARVRLLAWQEDRQMHCLIAAFAYKFPVKKKYKVCFIQTDRLANDKMAGIKSLDYALFADAYAKAKAMGFDEALLLNRKGQIFEASRANIFWYKDNQLFTPPLSSGCLNGITRQQIISQAKKFKIPVKEHVLDQETLKNADGAFITNALIGIQAISQNRIRLHP